MRRTVRLLLILPLLFAALSAIWLAQDALAQDASFNALAAWQLEEGLPPLEGPELFEEPAPSDGIEPLVEEEAEERLDGSAEMVPEGELVEPGPIEHAWQEPPSFWSRVLTTRDWICDCPWYSESELVLLHRTAPKSRALAQDVSFPSAGTLDADQTAYRIEPGLHLTVGKNLYRDEMNRDHSIEFTFLGFFDWESLNGIRSIDPNSIFTPLDPGFNANPLFADVGGFNAADTWETVQSSNFNSFEINGRIRYRLARDEMVMNPDGTWSRHIHPGLTPSLIYGLRTVVVEERFLAKSRRDGVDFADFGGNLDIDTENFMIGFQVGGDLVKRDEKFEYGVDMKFASLVNFAFADIDAVSNDNITGLTPVDLHQRATEANMAFLGEVDFGVKYYFHPDWSIGSNVEMTWIQGIAVATRQRNDFNSNFGAPPSVDVSANAFYLGLSVGLTGKW